MFQVRFHQDMGRDARDEGQDDGRQRHRLPPLASGFPCLLPS